MKLVIIGGSNIDYIGYSNKKILMEDSNPGKINVTFGGVARNITENLLRLGSEVTFITAIGNDVLGKAMRKELLDLKCHLITPDVDMPSSAYLSVNDDAKDMVVSICDNDIIKSIDQDFLLLHKDVINDAEYVLIDANLDKEMLDFFFEHFGHKKILAEGVSASKVVKLKNYLNKIYLMKVNRLEYNYLEVRDDFKPLHLIITSGARPVHYINNDENMYFNVPALKDEEIVSTVGSGDAFISGIIYGLDKGMEIKDAISLGIKASGITLKSASACAKNIKEILQDA